MKHEPYLGKPRHIYEKNLDLEEEFNCLIDGRQFKPEVRGTDAYRVLDPVVAISSLIRPASLLVAGRPGLDWSAARQTLV